MAEALNSTLLYGMPTTETEEDTMKAHVDEAENGNGTKRKYSRKDLEKLRSLNFEEQRKIWKGIYIGFDTAVAKEYDSLASNEHQKHVRRNYDPHQRCAKKQAPPILSKCFCSIDMLFFCILLVILFIG